MTPVHIGVEQPASTADRRSRSDTRTPLPPPRGSVLTAIVLIVAAMVFSGPWGPAAAQEEPSATRPDSNTSILTGRVVSAMARAPIPSARVRIDSVRRGAITDSLGHFTIADLPPGPTQVSVSHPAIEDKSVPLELRPDAVTKVTLLLSKTILRLKGIEVTVERKEFSGKLSGFEERREQGLGHFITPEQIEERDPRRASDLLRNVPGVRVSSRGLGGAVIEMARKSRSCYPALYVDGVPVPKGQIDELNVADVLAVEVYKGASETPIQYSRNAANCGVILVWIRPGPDSN